VKINSDPPLPRYGADPIQAKLDQRNPDSRMAVQMLDIPEFSDNFDCEFHRNCEVFDEGLRGLCFAATGRIHTSGSAWLFEELSS
jgi:hypothetical protein